MKKLDFLVSVKITKNKVFFGPGPAKLLGLVQKTQSIKKATDIMNMSYSKGWKMINTAEIELGYPLTTRLVGGSGGGSTTLTEKGRLFLENYYLYKKEVESLCEGLFTKYF